MAAWAAGSNLVLSGIPPEPELQSQGIERDMSKGGEVTELGK